MLLGKRRDSIAVADETWKAVAAVVVLIIAIIVIYLEFRILRRKREARAGETGLSDQAYNSILTTKAIASSLERTCIKSMEARGLIRKAEEAREAGDNRAAMDYCAQAKEVLMKEKRNYQQVGDLAKLPKTATAPAVPEETTKEKLQKELPKNYLQAKFMLTQVRDTIAERVRQGGDVTEARRLLGLAQESFDAKDYDGSLKNAVQAKNAVEELVIEIKDAKAAAAAGLEVQVTVIACRSCGAAMTTEDLFCRKCGVKIEEAACPSCGAKPLAGDQFCRKCGVAIG